jgi:hypothetical protein
MMNAVIAIYLAKLFGSVLAVMGVGCVFERSVPAGIKIVNRGGGG